MFMSPVQLDIFNDSRDVMLRNDVLQALLKQQPALAQSAWRTLHSELKWTPDLRQKFKMV